MERHIDADGWIARQNLHSAILRLHHDTIRLVIASTLRLKYAIIATIAIIVINNNIGHIETLR